MPTYMYTTLSIHSATGCIYWVPGRIAASETSLEASETVPVIVPNVLFSAFFVRFLLSLFSVLMLIQPSTIMRQTIYIRSRSSMYMDSFSLSTSTPTIITRLFIHRKISLLCLCFQAFCCTRLSTADPTLASLRLSRALASFAAIHLCRLTCDLLDSVRPHIAYIETSPCRDRHG